MTSLPFPFVKEKMRCPQATGADAGHNSAGLMPDITLLMGSGVSMSDALIAPASRNPLLIKNPEYSCVPDFIFLYYLG